MHPPVEQVPLEQLATPTAGLFPEYEHFEVFAGLRPDESYRWNGVGGNNTCEAGPWKHLNGHAGGWETSPLAL